MPEPTATKAPEANETPASTTQPAPPAQSTKPVSSDVFLQGEPDERAFLEQAPLIKKPGKTVATKEDISTESNKDPSKEVAVKKEDPTEPQEPKLIKVGESEMTEDDWGLAVHALKNKKDFEGFKATLTKKSGLFNAFNDEDLGKLYGYVTNKQSLPKDFRKTMDLPESFTFDNEFNESVTVKTKDIPEKLLEQIKNHTIQNIIPEFFELRNMKSKYGELEKTVEIERQTMGREFFTNFMATRPNIQVTTPVGEGIESVLNTIKKDKDHPEHENAIRMIDLMKRSTEEKLHPEAVYKALYGKENLKKQSQDQIRENQLKAGTELPGAGSAQDKRTEDQKALDRDVDPTYEPWRKSLGL